MKIILVSWNFYPRIGGPASFTMDLAKNLVKKGIFVKVVGPCIYNERKEETFDGFTVAYPKKVNIPTETCKNLFGIFSLGNETRSQMTENYDIIQAQDMSISALSAYFGNVHHKPLIARFSCDFVAEFYSNYKGRLDMSIQKLWGKKDPFVIAPKLVQKFVTSRYDCIIALNEYLHSILIEFGVEAGKIAIIPHGLDLQEFDVAKKIDLRGEYNADYIGIVTSRLTPIKGIQLLIRAMPEIKKEIKYVKFLILGEGFYKNELKKLAKKLGVENYFIFYGKVNRERIPSFVKSSDFLVMPSLFESFGVSLLEAMACKTPIVANNVGGVSSTLDGSGILTKPDYKSVSRGIIDLLSDAQLRNKIAKKGRNIVERKYSWDMVTNKYIQLYESIILKKF